MRNRTVAGLVLAAMLLCLSATAALALSPELIEGYWECMMEEEAQCLALTISPDGSYQIYIYDLDPVHYELDKKAGRIGITTDYEEEHTEWINYKVNADSLTLAMDGEEIVFDLLYKPEKRNSPVVGRWLANFPEEDDEDLGFAPERLILEFDGDGQAVAMIADEAMAGEWSVNDEGRLEIEVEGEICEGIYSAKADLLIIEVEGESYEFRPSEKQGS